MELKLNYSQDIVTLQTKYSLFKRVLNIVFSLTIDGGFDRALMTNAINKVIERNDCLRIRFFKKGKETLQTIDAERKIGDIPTVRFEKVSSMESFIKRFRKKPTDAFKGQVLEPVFATDPSGAEMILFKISHLVADTYGIGVLVNDLMECIMPSRTELSFPQLPAVSKKCCAKTMSTAPTTLRLKKTSTSSKITMRTAIRSTLCIAEYTAMQTTVGSSIKRKGTSPCLTCSYIATHKAIAS